MKQIFVIITILFVFANVRGATLSFSGSSKPVGIKTDSSSGLDMIYVLENAEGVVASFKASSSSPKWQRYSNLGGGYAEDIPSTVENGVTSITLPAEDYGYIIEDGTSRYYFWITNYANHRLELNSIGFDSEQECDRARLVLDGNAGRIVYYTINGQQRTISREMQLSYATLQYDETMEIYTQKEVSADLEYVDHVFSCVAPLCNTQFILSGDRFMKEWGGMLQVTSETYTAIGVEVHTNAIQAERDYPNEQKVESEGLGGSGPVEVTFQAAVTDAAIFTEWQLSNDPEFETVYDRYQDLDFTFVFRDQGTSYVRFVADNAAGTCEYVGETYTVFVGESMLLCPNAFSPGASEGVNDEWRVSYKSIVDFDCHIFNRWGQEMIHLTNPGQGWDGKYKGKLVPAGAYYYVIKAVGTDGRKYNLSGDINIIRSRMSTTSSGPIEE